MLKEDNKEHVLHANILIATRLDFDLGYFLLNSGNKVVQVIFLNHTAEL